MDSATLGNITYGYLGTYLGFSEETLYKGGGFVNVKNLGLNICWFGINFPIMVKHLKI